MFDITNSIFHDEDAARGHLETQRWADGVFCPFCKQTEAVKALPPEAMMSKPSKKNPISKPTKGWYHCKACRKKFTVSVGTVMERSHIPLHKWLLAFRLMASSKKGVSAHQIHRSLGITYKSAWFLAMRVREAMGMKPEETGAIGGENKVVESDETYVGGKARNVHKSKPIPKKHAVVTLVERDGSVRATHVANVTAKKALCSRCSRSLSSPDASFHLIVKGKSQCPSAATILQTGALISLETSTTQSRRCLL
jgi:transposase-like protein